MDLGLSGTVALIVGGTGTVGTAVARAFVAEGAVVVLASRSADRLAPVVREVGAAGFVTIDTRDPASVDAAVAHVTSTYGPVGVLVNTAAPSARTLDSSKDDDPAQILDAIDGKAMGYLRCATAVIPQMRAAGSGRIINVNGQNSFLTGTTTGSVRNAAVTVLSKNLADSLAGTGVTVNVVNPGTVTETPSAEVVPARGGESTPGQVAALVTFLASAAGAAISGEAIAVGHRVRGVISL